MIIYLLVFFCGVISIIHGSQEPTQTIQSNANAVAQLACDGQLELSEQQAFLLDSSAGTINLTSFLRTASLSRCSITSLFCDKTHLATYLLSICYS